MRPWNQIMTIYRIAINKIQSIDNKAWLRVMIVLFICTFKFNFDKFSIKLALNWAYTTVSVFTNDFKLGAESEYTHFTLCDDFILCWLRHSLIPNKSEVVHKKC